MKSITVVTTMGVLLLTGCVTSEQRLKIYENVEIQRQESAVKIAEAYNPYEPELDFQPMKTSLKTIEVPKYTDENGDVVETVIEETSEVDSEALAVHLLGKVALELARNQGRRTRREGGDLPKATPLPQSDFVQGVKAVGNAVAQNGGWIGGVAKWVIGSKLATDVLTIPHRVGDDIFDSYNDESTTITKSYAPPEE